MANSIVTNEDCMAMMAGYPDGHFELAVVDPPYGLGEKLTKQGKTSHLLNRSLSILNSKWDSSPPNTEYFSEVIRVSKNQIIWGGNYFTLPPTRCIIAWDKCQPWENFSQFELAWTSFDKPAALFKFDNRTGDKIHPTQKPIALYDWIFSKYAKEGDKILDTHLGSGSSRIAAHKAGLDFTACELDVDYFAAQEKRFSDYMRQGRLFDV